MLPILHLNGYKIANPTVLARIGPDELEALLRGYGHEPLLVSTDDALAVHELLADALDRALDQISEIQSAARAGRGRGRPRWPMIVLRTPKGWTGPKIVDGLPGRGQLPLAPGAAGQRSQQSHASGAAGGVAAFLPAGGAVRRGRRAARGAGGAAAARGDAG